MIAASKYISDLTKFIALTCYSLTSIHDLALAAHAANDIRFPANNRATSGAGSASNHSSRGRAGSKHSHCWAYVQGLCRVRDCPYLHPVAMHLCKFLLPSIPTACAHDFLQSYLTLLAWLGQIVREGCCARINIPNRYYRGSHPLRPPSTRSLHPTKCNLRHPYNYSLASSSMAQPISLKLRHPQQALVLNSHGVTHPLYTVYHLFILRILVIQYRIIRHTMRPYRICPPHLRCLVHSCPIPWMMCIGFLAYPQSRTRGFRVMAHPRREGLRMMTSRIALQPVNARDMRGVLA